MRNPLKYVHKDQHAGTAEILVDGEVMDNALEAQEDEWYTVEFLHPDKELMQMIKVVVRTDCKNVKIFEIIEDVKPAEPEVVPTVEPIKEEVAK